jgi:thioredoxin reductase
MNFIDVAIIGGGPAGLTAAGTLARQLHTAVVFDTKSYRNKKSTHMHMVPTWDHKDPEAFRTATKESILARYSTVQFLDIGVTNVEKKTDSHFKVTDATGKERDFRKIILAVGMNDVFPEIEGYAALWTKKM